MSYGENYGTDTLIKQLDVLAKAVRYDCDEGRMGDAVEDARNLMQGAMELWSRLVEEAVA